MKSLEAVCKAWCISNCYANITNPEPLSDPVFNAQFTLSAILRTCHIYVSMFIPKDIHDFEYEEMYLRTVIDAKKVYDGVVGVPFAKILFQEFLKSIDFEPKLPHFPVRSFQLSELIRTSMIYFKGSYHYRNLTIKDPLSAFKLSTRFKVILRFVGKINDDRKTTFLFSLTGIGETKN